MSEKISIKDLRKGEEMRFSELGYGASFSAGENICIKLHAHDCCESGNTYCLSTGFLSQIPDNRMVTPVHLTVLVERDDETD